MSRIVRLGALLAALAAAAIPSCIVDDHDPSLVADGDVDGGGDATPPAPRTALDILFVIDNSGSMAEEQAVLSRALPEFLGGLYTMAESRGLSADINVGVVSTDMGTGGYVVSTCSGSESGDGACLQHTPSPDIAGCSAAYPLFLSRNAANAATYPVADFARDFSCIATLGTAGCGFEQQFAAARSALTVNDDIGECNSGFLRPRSVVAVIYVTDEDDCTVAPEHPEMFDQDRTDLGHLNIRCFLHPDLITSVGEQVAGLRALEAEDHVVVVGALVGVPPDGPACIGFGDALGGCLDVPAMTATIDPAMPTQLVPACSTAMGVAFPATRFVQLAQAFGPHAYVASICAADYKDPLVQLAGRIIQAM